MNHIADIRKEYMQRSLMEAEVEKDAVRQFECWWQEAIESKIDEVNAMTLATADSQGIPHARIVLLKGFDENGFVFYTNYQSHKAHDIEENPNACLVFFWKELERQVRIVGVAERVTTEESDLYFSSRPEESQLGAWASEQSSVILSRADLEYRFAQVKTTWADRPISRPPYWGGYRVKPNLIEFWQGRPGRLHDRLCYRLKTNERNWEINRLMP